MPIGYGHIWKCSNIPLFLIPPHPIRQVGMNDFDIWAHVWWPRGSDRCHFYYIDLLSKRSSSWQNHLKYPIFPQTNGIGVDVTCLTVSTPVFLRSVIRRSGQWEFVEHASRSLCGAGKSQVSYRVYGPLILVDFAASWSLSGLLSPKFEFVWIADVILFQSLMCLFLMQWSVTADLMANRKHYNWAWAGEFKAFVKRLFTNTLTNVGRKDACLLNVRLARSYVG